MIGHYFTLLLATPPAPPIVLGSRVGRTKTQSKTRYQSVSIERYPKKQSAFRR